MKTDKYQLIHGDAQIELKKLEKGSVDLVIIDPPYLINQGKSGGAFGANKQKYHGEISHIVDGFDLKILEELHRVMKGVNLYIFANKTLFFDLINYYRTNHPKLLLDALVWQKTNPIPVCHNKYLSDLEYVLFVKEKGVRIGGTFETKKKVFQSPLNVKDKRKYGHPTPKPVEFLKKLIINSSSEGDTVLDCFAGSFSTGEASLELNRKFIGIEMDAKYIEIGKERLKVFDPDLLLKAS